VIELIGVSKRFGSKLAVDGLTLTVPAGELFAFLGPNGAGKTTTIKMITGLLRPTTGSVRVCGHDLVAEPIGAKAKVGYVPDQPYLYDKLSGREFLRFVAELYGLPRDLADQRIAEAMSVFELDGYADDLCDTYSHGMRQRFVFAATLIHDPEMMVVDEPLVGLDPKSARLVKDILRDRATRGGCVFMSTHTLSVAEEAADRIGIIHRGRMIALGTLSDLQRQARENRGLEETFLRLTDEEEA